VSTPASAPPLTFSPGLSIADPLAAYWIRQVTLRLRREICWLWRERGVLAGLALPSGALPPFTDRLAATLDFARYADEKARFFVEDATAGYLTGLIASPPPEERAAEQPHRGGFAWAARELGLIPADRFVLALALAPAVDGAAGTVFAACQNDPVRAYPTLALAQRLWDAPEEMLALIEPAHPLGRHGLLANTVDWDSALAVHAPVARQLLFPASPLPAALQPLAHASESILPRELELTLARLRTHDRGGLRVVPVHGAPAASLEVAAAQIAKAVAADAVRPAAGVQASELPSLCTLAWLRGAVLHVPFAMLGREHDGVVVPPLAALPLVLTVGVEDPGAIQRLPADAFPVLRIRSLDYASRLAIWRRELAGRLREQPELAPVAADCARRFRQAGPAVVRTCRVLGALGRPLEPDDLYAACRADVDLGELAQRLEPRFRVADLMLPAKPARQIAELIRAVRSLTSVHYDWGTARAWNEGGLSALFAGAPGTGKTMAAEVIAAEAEMPLYRIDLSQVVNKYIGETEKNLRRLFDAADAADVILFFDEADALFGKRTEVKDAHDRYANLEVSYLLERMERFKGLAILATNRKKDLDEAFLRRLRFVVDFPMPGPSERLRIWSSAIPPGVDASAVDLPFLAERFALAGGHIRSIVFHACLQSAGAGAEPRLDMPAVLRAVRSELDKLGRAISLEQFSPFTAALEE
jgi:hypothetical protein